MMDRQSVWCKTVDVLSGRCFQIYPGGHYWAFVEEGYGDFEISFKPGDGQSILALLEQALSSKSSVKSSVSGELLVHRFINQDGDEGAAFLVRERLEGIEVTFVDDLKDADDPTSPNIAGMNLCISREDAMTLTNVFREQLNHLADCGPAVIRQQRELSSG
jgi:hypothetical protein